MRWATLTAGLYGVIAIALGAFAAHGFIGFAEGLGYSPEEAVGRLENLETGARYQLATAAALLAIGLAAPRGRVWTVAAALLAGGAAIFSGCLYLLSVTGDAWRWLGAVVPIGGVGLIAGWTTIAIAAWRTREAIETTPTTSADQLVRLQEVITHQQHLVQELDTALTDARRDTDAAVRRIAKLEPTVTRLAEAQEDAEDLPDERPPHY